MARKVTIFTGQWADLPLEKLAPMMKEFGYDGLELATWGDHFDIDKAVKSKAYCEDKRAFLAQHGLDCFAISNHIAGQLTCDRLDERHEAFAPAKLKGDYKAMAKWAVKHQMDAAKAARNFGVKVVTSFTGSPIWHLLYSWPPAPPAMIEAGFKQFAKIMTPILDCFGECGVKFALEVHPTEIAFDIASAQRALEAVGNHPAFGFNYDPSHFGYQGVDYVKFLYTFKDRIFHAHVKDAWWGKGDGTVGVFGGHTEFADPRRYWDFRSPGHGDIDFERIIVALNDINYAGPLSVEWEDSRMDRLHGAKESAAFVRKIDFERSAIAFDGQFANA
ncbi:MAG: sugar phosphate isomerase/epimerase [Kiritimatiellae bacterium]|nr:sugar phosphate isomerase/epimerase [Kiritimatiellia bacterium]